MVALSIFKCIECDKEYNIREIRYQCDCGNLLEIIHDLDAFIPYASAWKKSLDGKMKENFNRYFEPMISGLEAKSLSCNGKPFIAIFLLS